MRHLRNPAEVLSYALDNRPRIQAESLPPRAGSPGGADVPCGLLPPDHADRRIRHQRLSLVRYGCGVNPAFGRQFRNNSTEYVGVAINIPIFNRMATRNSVRTAKPAAGLKLRCPDRSRADPAKRDRNGLLPGRCRPVEIPFGGKSAQFRTGRLQVRSREIRCGPLDDLRLQRRQDPHAEGRIRPDPGQIRPYSAPRSSISTRVSLTL